MKVFIAGGTGRVAAFVIRDLIQKGHTVVAGCRHPESLQASSQLIPVKMDLHADVKDLAAPLEGCGAVYFLAGSRGRDLLQTDAFGAVKLMMAAESQHIRRFIMLSSLFALQPEKWKEEPGISGIIDYDIAKFFADSWLEKNTDLDWTIVQASLLTEEPGSGRITLDPPHEGDSAIENVAIVLADVLDLKNTWHKVIMIQDGGTPIDQALQTV